MRLDATDQAILDVLGPNARISNREVARILGISETLVRQRLKRMIEEKAMRFGLVADMGTVGYVAGVIVRLRTVPVHTRAICDSVAKLESCAFAGLTLGRFDVLIYLVAQGRQEIAAIVDQHIAPLEGVVEVDVREPISSAKQRFDMVVIR